MTGIVHSQAGAYDCVREPDLREWRLSDDKPKGLCVSRGKQMRGRRNHVSRSNDSKAAHKMRRGQSDAARQAGLCESGVDVASAVADQRKLGTQRR